jgi:glycine/D-amino acid oxidase-like deaminating enzyme
MTVSYWLDEQSDKKQIDTDVAIIGGGIAGASSAYWLQKRNLKTVVLEAQQPGFGASGRNGGFILRGIVAYYSQAIKAYGRQTAKWIFQFNEETHIYLKEFVEAHGNSFCYDPSGSYLLSSSLEEMQELEQSVTLMQEDGFIVEYLKADPLKRNFYSAIFNSCDAGVHPKKLLNALLVASGAQVFSNSPVFSHELLPDKRIRLYTPDKIITCSTALLTTNAYTSLLEPWFLEKIQPIRGQILVTKPLKKRILDKICYANYGYEYFRQLPDDRLLLGGRREQHREHEIGYADMVTESVQSALKQYLKERFPEAFGVPIDYNWSGIMAFTRDGLPLIGEMNHLPGMFFAVGCNGHGMGYSLALSKLLVEVALDNATSGIFDAKREILPIAECV